MDLKTILEIGASPSRNEITNSRQVRKGNVVDGDFALYDVRTHMDI
jgi:hypothetical protein